MADQPYDPYIPQGGAGSGAGNPGNQRTAAIQAVSFFLSFSPLCSFPPVSFAHPFRRAPSRPVATVLPFPPRLERKREAKISPRKLAAVAMSCSPSGGGVLGEGAMGSSSGMPVRGGEGPGWGISSWDSGEFPSGATVGIGQ